MTTMTPPSRRPTRLAASTPDWRTGAACRDADPETFFPIGHSPVIERCLRWALETGQETGVWGGLAEDDRRAFKQKPTRPINIPEPSNPKNRSHRYPGYATAVDGILGTRLEEVQALVEQHASVHDIASALGTNMPTVRKVLERLEQPFDDGMEKVDHAAVNKFVQGFPVQLTDAEFLTAVQICVGREMTLADIDQAHGWDRKTAENWVNRLRKRFQRAGREFPSLAQPGVRVFTEREVIAIRERSRDGASDVELGMSYNASRETIRAIVTGNRYAQFGGPIRSARSARSLKASRERMCGHAANSRAAMNKTDMGEAA
jgi:hypothetical protein